MTHTSKPSLSPCALADATTVRRVCSTWKVFGRDNMLATARVEPQSNVLREDSNVAGRAGVASPPLFTRR